MPVDKLTELDPSTPWLEYINKVLTTGINVVTGDEMIIVDVPSYVREMSQLLAATPARVPPSPSRIA